MKKLSKLFVALTLVCSVALSAGCGAKGLAGNLDKAKSRLEDSGYNLLVTESSSSVKALKNDVKALKLKKGFYEIVATKDEYMLDEDVNFSYNAIGNYYEDAEGAYVKDGNSMREYVDGDTGTRYSRDFNLYVPETDGGYIYDATEGRYVEDTAVKYYFLIKKGDYSYDVATDAYVLHETADAYVEDAGKGAYVQDSTGIYVVDDEGNFVIDDDDNYSPKEDGTYYQDSEGAYVKNESGAYVLDDDVNYSFDKRGDYVYDEETQTYKLDDKVRFKCVENGNFVSDKDGDYIKQGDSFVKDTNVYYNRATSSTYVKNAGGKYTLNGTDYVDDGYSGYVKEADGVYFKFDGKRYVKDGSKYVDAGKSFAYDSVNGLYAEASAYYQGKAGVGEYYYDGTQYKLEDRTIYVKNSNTGNYVVDTGDRYVKSGANYVKVDHYSRIYYDYTVAEDGGYIFKDGKFVSYNRKNNNYKFVEGRYDLDDAGDYLYNAPTGKAEVGTFALDRDVNYSQDETTGVWAQDDDGDYIQATNTIVVFVFQKSGDAKTFYNKLRPDLYKKYFKSEFKDESNAYYANIVSAINGKFVYLGIANYLDVLGDIRL